MKKRLTKIKLMKANISKKKEMNKQKAIKTYNIVKPVSTPVGSVHFDEFLKICKEPKLHIMPIVKNVQNKKNKKSKKSKKGGKTKKGRKSKKSNKIKKSGKTKKDRKSKKSNKIKKGGKKKNKMSKTKKVLMPTMTPPLNETYPSLFPLIKALLLPADDDPLKDNSLFSVSYTKRLLIKDRQVNENNYSNS